MQHIHALIATIHRIRSISQSVCDHPVAVSIDLSAKEVRCPLENRHIDAGATIHAVVAGASNQRLVTT